MEGDEDNENDSDDHDRQKDKDMYTPLWKYVTKLSGGKGGGIGKFICHHCHKDDTGSYTRVRKHLCGLCTGMKVRGGSTKQSQKTKG
jgi:hypothetical protein